ncbi:hypothetical protein BDW_07425 [Bdellovibrio bacteriovorus W]|nr:hypothetical protein BDW_07425 [Bdellovibrio bacteriovorus W]
MRSSILKTILKNPDGDLKNKDNSLFFIVSSMGFKN